MFRIIGILATIVTIVGFPLLVYQYWDAINEYLNPEDAPATFNESDSAYLALQAKGLDASAAGWRRVLRELDEEGARLLLTVDIVFPDDELCDGLLASGAQEARLAFARKFELVDEDTRCTAFRQEASLLDAYLDKITCSFSSYDGLKPVSSYAVTALVSQGRTPPPYSISDDEWDNCPYTIDERSLIKAMRDIGLGYSAFEAHATDWIARVETFETMGRRSIESKALAICGGTQRQAFKDLFPDFPIPEADDVERRDVVTDRRSTGRGPCDGEKITRGGTNYYVTYSQYGVSECRYLTASEKRAVCEDRYFVERLKGLVRYKKYLEESLRQIQ